MVRLFAQQYQTENFKQWKITLKLWLQQNCFFNVGIYDWDQSDIR